MAHRRKYDSASTSCDRVHLLRGGVHSASAAFGPAGELLDVVTTDGVLLGFDASGGRALASGVLSVAVTFGPAGEVTLVLFRNGSLVGFDALGPHLIAVVS